jgi:hypothetical protein
MSFRLINRLMVVLAAFAILSGAMASPVRAVAAEAGMIVATAGDDCAAMKMGTPCPASQSEPCKMTASDCAKMLSCCDSLPGAMMPLAAPVTAFDSLPVSYDALPAALRGRTAEPALFPPRAT